MKRILIGLLGLSLIFAFACKRSESVTTRLIADTGRKTITIAISDDGSGGYTVEASVPNKAYLKKGHKARWIVINNTEKAAVSSVVIDTFRDPDGHTDPFEGTPADQKFEFTTPLGPGDESEKTSNRAKNFGAGPHRYFKYKVTVKIASVDTPITVDPVVVVGD